METVLVSNRSQSLLIAPLVLFLVIQRIPSTPGRRERHSVWWTNLAMLCVVAGMSWIFGIKAYLLIQLIVTMVAGAGGVWMFYVQHQFEGVYWERGDNWNYTAAALQGSSFYKLPGILQWFSGNIGFHHIHHLARGFRTTTCRNATTRNRCSDKSNRSRSVKA